ncbi:MAG TPA: PDZ domain-containing protein [Novimethylophilus sp.]|jgi:hypothetical protein|uniref:PDZ domain-containing protein n=1 Tax=Novimethylophilus sp. TaxID=2137426 RepID=UPI002F423B5E
MRQTMLFIFLLGVGLLGVGCASKAPIPAPPTQANLYQQFYTQRMAPPAAKPAVAPRAYRGRDQETDNRHLLEDGYDLVGYSSFAAGDVAPEQVLEQATRINADLVLVYTKRSGLVTLNVQKSPAGTSQQTAERGQPKGRLITPHSPQYEYIASYWAKLPPPVLGLHVQDPGKNAVPGGLPVVAVVKDSPAAAAEIQAGDLLLRIGDTDMLNADTLRRAMRRYAGQSVEIVFARAAETMRRTIVLNTGND